MKVKFIDVGRTHKTWESECPTDHIGELEYDWLWTQVKSEASVMSNDLDFLLNKDDMTNGVITAGFHTIGRFQIVGGADDSYSLRLEKYL